MSSLRQKMTVAGRLQCWISLLFISFVAMPFLSTSFMSPLNRWSGWVSLLACVAYLPMHFASYQMRDSRKLYLLTIATFLIGAVTLPFNWAGYTFFLYACFIGGDYFSRTERVVQFLAVNAGSLPFYWWWGVWPGYPIVQVLVTFTAGLGIWAEFERKQKLIKVAETEIAQERIAKSADRERIARDLHDLLGHTLSVIALKSELAGKLAARDPLRAANESAEVAHIARQALQQVRQAIVGLRSVSLIEAVRQAEATLTAAGLRHEIHVGPIPAPSADAEHALAQALTEAITNIVRHSGADQVWIDLHHEAGEVVLTVRDNGQTGAKAEGNGLSGMHTRLAAVGGSVAVNQDQGWQVRAVVPAQAG